MFYIFQFNEMSGFFSLLRMCVVSCSMRFAGSKKRKLLVLNMRGRLVCSCIGKRKRERECVMSKIVFVTVQFFSPFLRSVSAYILNRLVESFDV